MVKSKKLWEKIPAELSPKQRRRQVSSLNILSLMREGKSLRQAAIIEGLDARAALRYLGPAVKKKGMSYVAKQFDRLFRTMPIIERGVSRESEVIVLGIKGASLVGKYNSALRQLIVNGDPTRLAQFKGLTVTDAYGKKHVFETNVQNVIAVAEQKEDREFTPFYR